MGIKYGSVCSGVEAATVAWHSLGWEPQWFSEIEKFPSGVLNHHYPHVPNLGDMTKLEEREEYNEREINLLVGGTPCFSGDTLITTREGFKEISQIKIGDEVLTHLGRWRRVVDWGSKKSTTRNLRIHGALETITTDDHPYLTKNGWVRASELSGKKVTSVSITEESKPGYSDNHYWLFGRFLADGWTRKRYGRGKPTLSGFIIACNEEKSEVLEGRIYSCGLNFTKTKEKTCNKYTIYNKGLAEYLDCFGSGASNKEIPVKILSLPREQLEEFLLGYLSGDGCAISNGRWSVSTTSKKIVLGLGQIVHKLYGAAVNITKVKVSDTKVIDGRVVNQLPWYRVQFSTMGTRYATQEGEYLWRSVRKTEASDNILEVFNITVEEDNTYVANGIVVHNCQSFSIAGLRKGLGDERGNLALEFCRILLTKRPQWFVWENVPGVFSSNNGEDFRTIITAFTEIGYGVSWRVLDAQYFGVAQRRRRVFVVGYFGDWRPPRRVLFEPESLSRDTEKGRGERKRHTDNFENGFRGTVGTLCAREFRGFSSDDLEAGKLIPTTYGLRSANTSSNGWGIQEEKTHTLDQAAPHSVAYAYSKSGRGGDKVDVRFTEDGKANTLNTGEGCSNQSTMNIAVQTFAQNSRDEARYIEGNKVGALAAQPGMKQQTYLQEKYLVRRLTPIECERLQGFPDNYTNIPWRGKQISPNGARYKAMGNSMAVPVMHWVGRRIQEEQDLLEWESDVKLL